MGGGGGREKGGQVGICIEQCKARRWSYNRVPFMAICYTCSLQLSNMAPYNTS